jgi:hypothetical protein
VNKKGKYAKLVSSLRAKGADDPRALAASIGRKKLGKAEFQRRAAAGRAEDMMEDKAEYGSEHCPKCAEYQMLIGEALAYYIKHKDDLEDKPDTSEVENETESKMDSEKA